MNFKVLLLCGASFLGCTLSGFSNTNEVHQSTVPHMESDTEKYPYALPFLAQKAVDAGQGEALPLPLGISVAYYYVERDIDVKSVSASLGNNPLQPVDNVVNFDVRTEVATTSMRMDAWILPFLNVYGLIANIENSSIVDMTFDIGTNNVPVKSNGGFDGVGTGMGIVLAGGYENFFMTFDANWLRSDLGDSFDTIFEGQIYTIRGGWKGVIDGHNTRLWLGGTYWDTERTMSGSVGSGATAVNFRVTQAPLNPRTLSIGGNYEFTKKVNLVADYGFNFEDAHIVLVSLNYRFF